MAALIYWSIMLALLTRFDIFSAIFLHVFSSILCMLILSFSDVMVNNRAISIHKM